MQNRDFVTTELLEIGPNLTNFLIRAFFCRYTHDNTYYTYTKCCTECTKQIMKKITTFIL